MAERKYKWGNTIWVRLETWVDCNNPPKDGIAECIFIAYDSMDTFRCIPNERYGTSFREIFHLTSNIVEDYTGYCVELL